MKNTRWTDDEKAALRRMWEDRLTVVAIAKNLGKSQSAVKNQRKFLKLPPRRTGDLTVKLRVGVNADDHDILRRKSIRHKQTVPGRIRELIREDNIKP